MQQVPTDSRACIERGQDEQSLEHNGKVVPQIEPMAPGDTGEDAGHSHRQGGCAACASVEGLFLNLFSQGVHLAGGNRDRNHSEAFGGGVTLRRQEP